MTPIAQDHLKWDKRQRPVNLAPPRERDNKMDHTPRRPARIASTASISLRSVLYALNGYAIL